MMPRKHFSIKSRWKPNGHWQGIASSIQLIPINLGSLFFDRPREKSAGENESNTGFFTDHEMYKKMLPMQNECLIAKYAIQWC